MFYIFIAPLLSLEVFYGLIQCTLIILEQNTSLFIVLSFILSIMLYFEWKIWNFKNNNLVKN